MRIDLENGKYTYVFDEATGKSYALRYGEQWRNTVGDGFILCMAQKIETVTEQRDALLAVLKGLVDDVQGLIGESHGVVGLHLNGDVAPWGELEAGGRFERLTHLPDAYAIIASIENN